MKSVVIFFVLLLCAYTSLAQIITTVAGQPGNGGYSGDGGPALQATIGSPNRLTFDRKGNLYFSERDNNIVRKIAPTGIITTVAGKGIPGFAGDGGPATSAQLNFPVGVAVDSIGNVFIADAVNSRIRKVDTAGIITTAYGTGINGYSGDGGPAATALLGYPNGLVFDSKWNLIICDLALNSHRIRMIDKQGIITTIAGSSGSGGYSGDGGPATAARMNNPFVCALNEKDDLFIIDMDNHRIRKLTRATGIITTIAGNGQYGYSGDGDSALSARFNYPRGIACASDGTLFIGEFSGVIRKIDTSGIITRYCGDSATTVHSGDGGPASQATLNGCGGLAFDSAGNLFVAEFYGHTIRRINLPPTSIATTPKPRGMSFSVYPNPVSGVLHIEVETSSGKKTEVRVVDYLGRVVAQQSLTTSGTSINMGVYPSGVYSVILICDGYVVDTESVVKQ